MQKRQGRQHQKPKYRQGRQQGDLQEVKDDTPHWTGAEGQVLSVLHGPEMPGIVMVHMALVREGWRQGGDAKQDIPGRAEKAHTLPRHVRDFVNEYTTSEQSECGDREADEISRREYRTGQIQRHGTIRDRQGEEKIRPVDPSAVYEEVLHDSPRLCDG